MIDVLLEKLAVQKSNQVFPSDLIIDNIFPNWTYLLKAKNKRRQMSGLF
jgi:hypothetical protein